MLNAEIHIGPVLTGKKMSCCLLALCVVQCGNNLTTLKSASLFQLSLRAMPSPLYHVYRKSEPLSIVKASQIMAGVLSIFSVRGAGRGWAFSPASVEGHFAALTRLGYSGGRGICEGTDQVLAFFCDCEYGSYPTTPHSHKVITDLHHLQTFQFIVFIYFIFWLVVYILMILKQGIDYSSTHKMVGDCDITLMASISNNHFASPIFSFPFISSVSVDSHLIKDSLCQ